MVWVALKHRSAMVCHACRVWGLTKWHSKHSQLPHGFFNFLSSVMHCSNFSFCSVLSQHPACWVIAACRSGDACARHHVEFWVSLTYACSYALDYVRDNLTVLCGQLACLSHNWKHWEDWCGEAGLVCLPGWLLPACPAVFWVPVQLRLKTSLLIFVFHSEGCYSFFIIFLLSALIKLTCMFLVSGLSSLLV